MLCRSCVLAFVGLWAAAAPAAKEPNPYTGRQEREEVFQFAQKPTVAKQGDKYVVRFASKAACDATVTMNRLKWAKIVEPISDILVCNGDFPQIAAWIEELNDPS